MPFPAFKPSEPPGRKAHRVSFLNLLMFNSLWAGFRLYTLVGISVRVPVGLFQYTAISSLSDANKSLTIKSLHSLQLSPLWLSRFCAAATNPRIYQVEPCSVWWLWDRSTSEHCIRLCLICSALPLVDFSSAGRVQCFCPPDPYSGLMWWSLGVGATFITSIFSFV